MNDPCVVVLSYGKDPYDHNEEVHRELYYGTWEGESNKAHRDYVAHYNILVKSGKVAWFKFWELNTETGNTKLWTEQRSPVKTRVELNIPAKEAKLIKKVIKPSYAQMSTNELLAQINHLASAGGGDAAGSTFSVFTETAPSTNSAGSW